MNYRHINYTPSLEPKMEYDENTNVTQGLAVTPAQMLEMTEAGVAISAFGLDYDEGSLDTFAATAQVPLERIRGIDVVDVWEAQQNARYKILHSSSPSDNS